MNPGPAPRGKELRRFLVGLSRPLKQFVAIVTDFTGYLICAVCVAWLINDGRITLLQASLIGAASIIASVALAWSEGLYRSVVRYMGLDLVAAGVRATASAALVGAIVALLLGAGVIALKWALGFWALGFIYACGSRYLARVFLLPQRALSERERVIVYGAGSAGVELTISLLASGEFLPVAMVDDDPTLHGKKVSGLEVHPPSIVEALIRDTGARRVLLAMPSASHRRRRQVLERLSEFPVHVQTVPGFTDIVSGKARVSDITDVDVIELLGRDPVPPNPRLLGASITGKSVMVTGAGGSIGSELCRQILRQRPSKLVLLELCEPALYEIDKKLRRMAEELDSSCEIVALLGTVNREDRVREALKAFRVKTVYHAAAYKHVQIVEQNLFEGIENNVFGTLHTARAAMDAGVETFVLISTDKAVSPTSIMGATKRFAEMILQACNSRNIRTRFCMVRFGNVLESSGSVVPLFREQIRSGGPVTVTHRDVIRYFMTIPEAAQLVIQAAAMARGGDVFVLDMGKPVRIRDLACRMINLMGLTVRDELNPDGDIEIRYVGLRPAEKLYEELLIGCNVTGTDHPRIMRADEQFVPYETLSALIRELEAASRTLAYDKARAILLRAVAGDDPSHGIDDLVGVRRDRSRRGRNSDTVIDFPSKPA